MRLNSRDLLSAIAQTHTEVTSSPAITSLTIQWACQNSVTSSRLDDDIRRPLRVVRCDRIAPQPGRSGLDLRGAAPGPKTKRSGSRIARADHDPKFREDPKPDPPPASRKQSRNLSKLGRTTARLE